LDLRRLGNAELPSYRKVPRQAIQPLEGTTLPGYKWKWRIRHSAVMFAASIKYPVLSLAAAG